MGKRFKLKLSRVIPSFQSCRSKDPSTLPSNPVPSFCRLSLVNPSNNFMSFNPHYLHLPEPPTPSRKPLAYSSIKRHVSSALTSMGCGSSRSPPTPPDPYQEGFHWEKEDRWHVVARLYPHESSDATPRRKVSPDDAVPFSPPQAPPNTDDDEGARTKKRRRHKHKKKTRNTGSGALFGSSSSSSSSSTDHPKQAVRRDRRRSSRGCVLGKKKHGGRRKSSSCSEHEEVVRYSPLTTSTPPRLSSWWVPCAVEGKVRESFAVVKRSQEPYEDFKRSMMEMVVEKRMFEQEDLEQLLHCFLSLNSRDHHQIIVRAFSEVWQALFPS